MGSPLRDGDTTGALNEDVVGMKARVLSADSAPESRTKKWIYGFVSDPLYGGFSVNVLADFFVRLLLLIGTSLSLKLCFRRAKRERISKELQLLKQFRKLLDEETALRRLAESISVGSAGTPGTPGTPGMPGVLQVDGSATRSSFAPPSSANVRDSSSSQGGNSGSSPQATSSTTALPTESKKRPIRDGQKGPCDELRKQNGYIVNKSRPLDQTSTVSRGSIASQTNSQSGAVPSPAQEHHAIDVPCSFTFPSSSSRGNGDKFKDIARDRLKVPINQDVSSSRIMQARVPATEENLGALRDLAIEGMRLDDGFTLQIGGSLLYYCNGDPEEPVLLSLRDVEVPTILQVEYSTGLLIIRGRYLEGAEIRAATSDGYMIFESVKQDPVNNNTVFNNCPLSLSDILCSWNSLDLSNFELCSSLQRRELGCGDALTCCHLSSLTGFKYLQAREYTKKDIVLQCAANFLLYRTLPTKPDPLHRSWLSYSILVVTMYIIQLLSPSLEENIKDFMERFKLAISSFHVFPKLLDSPAFIMHNGFCFQRGAKYLINSKLVVTGDENQEKESSNSTKKSPHNDIKDDDAGNLETKTNWKWPCWKTDYRGTFTKIDYDLNDDGLKSSDKSFPFGVIYDSRPDFEEKYYYNVPTQHLPKKTIVRLYSKYLQDIVGEWVPRKLKIFETYGEIEALDLFILYINGNLKKKESDLDSNLSPASSNDRSQRNDLHMFHLKRFLEKEYDHTIKEYNRMMEAGMIYWDMLWTLIVPNIDIIYYCRISKEELCGKVSATYYTLPKYVGDDVEFQVELESYDYNCNNFEVMKTKRKISPFTGDVKIIDLEIFPLKCKANHHESEECFFQRGQIYSDLVLKHEYQYMHYHGLMYDPSYSRVMEKTRSFKASIEGRVMIDQRWFAKIKPKCDMGTAGVAGWLQANKWLEVRKKAVANEFDSVLKYSPAIVYGYSFSIRKWGCFNIEGFSKIQYTSTVFDKVVMNAENKLILLTLTDYYIKHPQGANDVAMQVDLVPNKGEGCIILLHGPPGTGKTLTVESLAERLECPLWQLSISKLSASTKQLENKMLKTFEVAKSWGAILLLDEADVYLSSRKYSPMSSDNTQTNAMTGVFLRVLEHYKGILFLTTNEMDHIEPAIFSRISLSIKYEEFNQEERKNLWSNFLNKIKISHLSEEFWKKVLSTKFNGRVIRNIVQNAQILIQSKDYGTKTPEECLLKAFDAMATSSTMNYLIDSQEEASEGAPSAPSVQSASTNWSPIQARD